MAGLTPEQRNHLTLLKDALEPLCQCLLLAEQAETKEEFLLFLDALEINQVYLNKVVGEVRPELPICDKIRNKQGDFARLYDNAIKFGVL